MSSIGVIGRDHLVEFCADGYTTTVVMKLDSEMFGAHAVLRLIDFFPARLSKALFWSEKDAASGT